MDDGDVLYEETQRFTQLWIRAIVYGSAALIWYGGIRQLVLREPFGSNPASDGMLLVFVGLFGIGLPALFRAANLRTEVHPDGIHVRFFPFHLRKRRWAFQDIEQAEARTYSPLGEYGGWGVRIGVRGWAYNVKGDKGIQLVLRSGQRILIGTQDPDSFMVAIREARSGVSER